MTNRGVASIGGSTLGRGGRRPQVGDPLSFNDAANKRYADQVGLGLPSYVQGIGLKNKYSTERGLYNFKSSNTRRLDQGRADAMVGGITRHLVLGDSVTDGYTSFTGVTTIDHAHAWPLAMQTQLAVTGIPANGTGFVKMCDNTTLDTRWSQTGTWTNQVSWVFTNIAGSSRTYIAERPGTILDTWYLNATGTITISIDGAASGANFATATTNTAGAWVKYRMYGVTVNIGSTIKITVNPTGTGVGLSGVSIWSPNAGTIIDNLGMGGAKAGGTGSANFADMASGPLVVQRYVGGKSVTITDAVTTAGLAQFTSASSSFNATGDTLLGEPIDQFPDATGALFPPNTYITGRTNATTLTTSNAALVTASAKTLRLGRDPHCVHIALGGNDIQTSGLGGANVEQAAAGVKAIAALYPNSDIMLHLENQGSSTLWSADDYARWQKRLYLLADELDAPLYDWYDRTGSFTTALANGVFQDNLAHMIPGIYADLGSSLAQALGGGSGQPQYWNAPVYAGDLTNKAYVDRKSYSVSAANASVTTTVEGIVVQVQIPANTFAVGSSIELSLYMHPAASSVTTTKVRIGSAGTTSDACVQTIAASSVGVGNARFVDGVGAITAIGASAAFIAGGSEIAGGSVGSGASTATSGTFDSTVANWVSVTVTNTSSTTTTVYAARVRVTP